MSQPGPFQNAPLMGVMYNGGILDKILPGTNAAFAKQGIPAPNGDPFGNRPAPQPAPKFDFEGMGKELQSLSQPTPQVGTNPSSANVDSYIDSVLSAPASKQKQAVSVSDNVSNTSPAFPRETDDASRNSGKQNTIF